MRKVLALLAAAAIVASLSSTALAAKPKKIHETFGASLAPWPKLAAWGDEVGLTQPGCSSGTEGVNWVAQEFTAPGKGTLRVWMEGFTGDHDLYVFKDDVALLRSENSQVPVGSTDIAPAEEEILYPMAKGETITMVACNWLGQPDVLAHYEGTFK
ncbi:MAG: hypothetical protein QOG04_111 [Actinomycetota bacterium]|jgi:hypothetical protein|nr:hypothetical protein [Actinomycetota bacterium]